jgi:hypothetical protein
MVEKNINEEDTKRRTTVLILRFCFGFGVL